MMTRETKIGLGVACSFLCLLGVVLAGKYTTLIGTPTSADADTQVASNDNPEPQTKESKASDKGKKDPPSTTDTLPPLQPVPSDTPVVQTGGTNLDDLPPLPLAKNNSGSTAPAISDSVPAARPNESNQREEAPALPDPPPKTGKTDEKGQDDLPPLPPTLPEGNTSGDGESKAPTTKVKPTPDKETTTAETKIIGGDATKLPTLPVKEPIKKSEPAAEISIELPPPPALKKNPPELPATATFGTRTVPAMPLPADNLLPKEPASPPGGEKYTSDTGLPNNAQVALEKPVPAIAADSPRLAPRMREPLRAGNPTEGTPISRVPARPATASLPRVESFDEETYRPRQDDTFASISKRYYQTDKYAQALLLFNREHPRAAEGVRREPPDLTGQAVYIPPIHVLEKRHGNAIDGYTPPPSNPTPLQRETPRREGNASSGASTGANTTYQVSPNGETMMEIARAKLGNGDRWREIQQLNPGWRPDYPIPGGATLRLPAESR